MFYLGEFDEDEADEIRTFLGNAGIRVEVKPYLAMDKVETWALHGRYNRLKELMNDDETLSDFEIYLSAFRRALPESSNLEEFEEVYLNQIDPELIENRNRILALYDKEDESEDGEGEKGEGEEGEGEEGTSSEAGNATEEAETSEECESLGINTPKWINSILLTNEALRFARSVFSLNGISIGEPLGERLDDPVLEIPIDPEDYDPGLDELKFTIEFSLEKSSGLYIDEFTTTLASEIDDEFYDLFPEEYQQIKALGMLIEKLVTPPPDKRMSLDEFRELCALHLEDDDGALKVDGREATMELIRVLEKADIIKAKGERIKWK